MQAHGEFDVGGVGLEGDGRDGGFAALDQSAVVKVICQDAGSQLGVTYKPTTEEFSGFARSMVIWDLSGT